MGSLKLPEGTATAFRIEETDAFDSRFAFNAYGTGRKGWFVATLRHFGRDLHSGARRLPKGEWPTLLRLIDRSGFWALPENSGDLIDPPVEVEDGEWVTVAGRDPARYHRVHRFLWREPGLEALLAFARRVSGFFVRSPVSGCWVLPTDPGLSPQPLPTEDHSDPPSGA